MIKPTTSFENGLWKAGIKHVVGIDEVGRGSWAGPVVAAAVIFPPNINVKRENLSDVRDSKLLKAPERERLAKTIKSSALSFSVSEISVSRINNRGISKCTQYAFRKAIRGLCVTPEHLLVDAFYVSYINKSKQTPIIKGDRKCFSIAAASIIAKVHRDEIMTRLHEKYPQYRFDKHMGYGTKLHQEKIFKFGLSKIHRKSFDLTRYVGGNRIGS